MNNVLKLPITEKLRCHLIVLEIGHMTKTQPALSSRSNSFAQNQLKGSGRELSCDHMVDRFMPALGTFINLESSSLWKVLEPVGIIPWYYGTTHLAERKGSLKTFAWFVSLELSNSLLNSGHMKSNTVLFQRETICSF